MRLTGKITAACTALALTVCALFSALSPACVYNAAANAAAKSAMALIPTLPSGLLGGESENGENGENSEKESGGRAQDGQETQYSTEGSTEDDTKSDTESDTEKSLALKEITKTPADIKKLIEKAAAESKSDKRDADISETKYTTQAATDIFGSVAVKNTNDTDISIEQLLKRRADFSVSDGEPLVLIFHTHTTESYQMLDRSFYAQGQLSRSSEPGENMVRVGRELKSRLEENGVGVIHDETVYDTSYSGAYERSRQGVLRWLEKYPSIQIILDVHRDAIQLTDGTKIKPTAVINGKKAAQVMIISGCQEQGNGIEDFPDWEYNLVFALKLQQAAQRQSPGLMRPLFFCPRRYNMHLSHCSLLLEFGSDANTLDEAVYSARLIANALTEVISEN